MVKTNISTMKSQLSRYIDRVKGGQEVVISERDRPVAKLVPYHARKSEGGDWSARVMELARQGQIKVAQKSKRPLRLTPAPAPKGGARVLEALLEERRSGR